MLTPSHLPPALRLTWAAEEAPASQAAPRFGFYLEAVGEHRRSPAAA